jgi:FkbM family methyltransferase
MKVEFLTIPDKSALSNLPNRIFLYGVGAFATEIAAILSKFDIEILGFIDHVQAPSETWSGYKQAPYFNINEVLLTKESTVVIAVHNLHGNLQKISESILQINSQVKIFSPVELTYLLATAGVRIENYWLTSSQDLFDRNKAQIRAFESLLSDEKSKILFRQIIEYRRKGKINALPETELLEHQYAPLDLPTPPPNIRMVELGAYTGDNLREFVRRGLNIEFALSLEPDLQNFSSLVSTIEELGLRNVFALPLAGWDQTETLLFSDTGDAGAVMVKNGGSSITATSIDQIVGRSKINFIKMDIEGAELNAIQGAKNVIIQQTPHLAISVYHKPDDMWTIGLMIEEFSNGKYDYFLRQYGQQLFDTILYAIPNNQT